MSTIFTNLTEALIRDRAKERIFRRGQEYYEASRVNSVFLTGDRLKAGVQGTYLEPYRVTATLEGQSISELRCTCPSKIAGICKHAVAVLLFCLKNPGEITEKPSLEELISELDRECLEETLLEMAEARKELRWEIRNSLEASLSGDGLGPSVPEFRPQDLADHAYNLIHSLDYKTGSEVYYEGADIIGELCELIEKMQNLLGQGKDHRILTGLLSVFEVFVSDWTVLGSSATSPSLVFDAFARAATEAFISADLDGKKREKYTAQLEDWQSELEGYDWGGKIEPVLKAAVTGANHQDLKEAVVEFEQDSSTGRFTIKDNVLAEAYLSVLKRVGEKEKYRQIARFAEEPARVVESFLSENNKSAALKWVEEEMSSSGQELDVLKKLWSAGVRDRVLEIGRELLTEVNKKARTGSLAAWLRDRAVELNKSEVAQELAEVACKNQPSLSNYEMCKDLAADNWPEVQARVINQLKKQEPLSRKGLIDVFLAADEYEAALDQLVHVRDFDLIRKVCREAVDPRPERVEEVAREQAEDIMDQGRSKAYEAARDWLQLVKQAHKKQSKSESWNQYLERLLDKHSQKYKLVPELEKLGKL